MRVGLFGLALFFNAQFTMHNAQLCSREGSCFKACLTTPSPKCFHHSRAKSPHKIHTKPVKTEQTYPETSQEEQKQHTLTATEQKGAGKDNKDGGARGGDLKKGRPAPFCACVFGDVPFLWSPPRRTWQYCSYHTKRKGAAERRQERRCISQSKQYQTACEFSHTNLSDPHRIARTTRHISLL